MQTKAPLKLSMLSKLLASARAKLGGSGETSPNRMKAWQAADRRHNMSLPSEERNSRRNELGDHYSVGADLGPVMGPALGVAQEYLARPLLAAYPDVGNKLAPSVFNFKTPNNQRTGAIDPYTMPTYAESKENLKATLSGSLDNYPSLQRLLGLDEEVK